MGKKDTMHTPCSRGKGCYQPLLVNTDISDDELSSLMGLFRRYKIQRKQLEILVNERNQEWYEWCKRGFSINVYPAKK